VVHVATLSAPAYAVLVTFAVARRRYALFVTVSLSAAALLALQPNFGAMCIYAGASLGALLTRKVRWLAGYAATLAFASIVLALWQLRAGTRVDFLGSAALGLSVVLSLRHWVVRAQISEVPVGGQSARALALGSTLLTLSLERLYYGTGLPLLTQGGSAIVSIFLLIAMMQRLSGDPLNPSKTENPV
jgi:cell division protein FtsW (lipid II flippase)